MSVVHLEITGRVQGVGFRWFIREHARRRDLSGWVKNQPGGSVEIAAAGTDEALAALRDAVRAGPPGAWVERVVDLPTTSLGELPRPFQVLRS